MAQAVRVITTALAAAATTMMSCNQNNCLRAIEALSPRDMGLQTAPVAPATVTVTATSFETATTTLLIPRGGYQQRDVIPPSIPTVTPRKITVAPSSIPKYASACSGIASYRSACSCIGVTQSTTTAPTQTLTVVATGTTTVTTCEDPLPTFALKLSNSGIVYNDIALDGTYANADNGYGYLLGFNGVDRSRTDFYRLMGRTGGNLAMPSNGFIAYTETGQGFEMLHFDQQQNVFSSGYFAAYCSINIHSGLLTCSTGPSQNVLQLCPGDAITDDIFIGEELRYGCVAVTINVEPVCTVPPPAGSGGGKVSR
ncbi:hypothetical protein MMC30_005947 [Trapelia coarctata]|nr:hypothetical protein [Trapelia coarctata]